MSDKFTEFKKAYDAAPSQDNEWYVPDRAGFKSGFNAAWNLLRAQYLELDADYDREQSARIVAEKALGAIENLRYGYCGEAPEMATKALVKLMNALGAE